MAIKMGVTKSEILDPTTENMAVRLAVAETQIIGETKEYLEEHTKPRPPHKPLWAMETRFCLSVGGGVSLGGPARARQKSRSRTILLVKNLPAGTTVDDMTDLFDGFGALGRVVVPPTGTIALVEFLEENEAKVAFRKLAYSKYRHLPLYLEWAPVGSFREGFVRKVGGRGGEGVEGVEGGGVEGVAGGGVEGVARGGVEGVEVGRRPGESVAGGGVVRGGVKTSGKVKTSALTSRPTAIAEEEEEENDADETPVATLFVKNLNFTTTEETLREAFLDAKGLRTARISTKVDKKGKRLSMGFGFVEFDSRENARNAVKLKQGFRIEGHEIQLKFSNARVGKGKGGGLGKAGEGRGRVGGGEEEARSSKLVVRNIPFEASKKDVRQLFTTFGQVKSVRLPKKFDGTHRGFCFVDFLTKQEALAAFKSLSATHLYGRHLVIEWAEDDTGVEAVRKRTAKAFFEDDGGGGDGKRRRVTIEPLLQRTGEEMDED
ncbi:putative RNA-binding protein 19 [Dinochytrium kinnereticum]|nr:putative RNA-binding protein 19 [Dinochytrium kinnereticum]